MKKSIIIFITALSLCSCLNGLLPDPTYVATIKSMKVEGALNVQIDTKTNTVTLDMNELADLSKVKIDSCHFNNDTLVKPSRPLVGEFDLRTPQKFTLTTYQDYVWTVSAVQNINRFFTVEGQVGSSIIDEKAHTVTFGIPADDEYYTLDYVTVLTYKLGPDSITTYVPEDLTELYDFTQPVKVTVSYRDIKEEWTIIGKYRSVVMEKVSPRAKSCYFAADVIEGKDNGVAYREKGATQWIKAKQKSATEGNLIAYAENLKPSTNYEAFAFSGNDSTEVVAFTTTAEVQLPNGGFNVYSKAESNYYYSFYDPASKDKECQTKWWDDGNEGATTLGSSYAVTIPNTEDKKEGTASVQLISRAIIVKFAAGNFFAGEFAGLEGIKGGKVNFGRPFTARPDSLKLWIKYENGPIDWFGGCPKTDPVKIGDPDFGLIYIALGDWDAATYGGSTACPVQINTTDESTFFDPNGPNVIAYGTFRTYEKIGWTEITIPFDYHDDFRIPTHILISCASSGYGDYFTGSTKSRMWLDDFRLIY